MREDYLTVDEMARELGISRPTAWRWMREQELPTYRFMGDRKTYVKREDLDRFREPIVVRQGKAAARASLAAA